MVKESLPVETQYVLPSYRKSWSKNPLMLLVLTYDLLFKVICDIEDQIQTNQGQTIRNHSLYSNKMLLVVLIVTVSKKM